MRVGKFGRSPKWHALTVSNEAECQNFNFRGKEPTDYSYEEEVTCKRCKEVLWLKENTQDPDALAGVTSGLLAEPGDLVRNTTLSNTIIAAYGIKWHQVRARGLTECGLAITSTWVSWDLEGESPPETSGCKRCAGVVKMTQDVMNGPILKRSPSGHSDSDGQPATLPNHVVGNEANRKNPWRRYGRRSGGPPRANEESGLLPPPPAEGGLVEGPPERGDRARYRSRGEPSSADDGTRIVGPLGHWTPAAQPRGSTGRKDARD